MEKRFVKGHDFSTRADTDGPPQQVQNRRLLGTPVAAASVRSRAEKCSLGLISALPKASPHPSNQHQVDGWPTFWVLPLSTSHYGTVPHPCAVLGFHMSRLRRLASLTVSTRYSPQEPQRCRLLSRWPVVHVSESKHGRGRPVLL